jgi:DNA-binding IclR family transcriptional regulator
MTSPPVKRPAPKTGAQAIGRALSLLFAFTAEEPERRVTELSRALDLNKSTTHRLLQALVEAGLVRHDPRSGSYRLGPSVLTLAATFLAGQDLRTEARPFIEALSREQGESVNLAVLDGHHSISIDNVVAPQSLQLVSRLGRRIPIYCSAAGKALILEHSETELRTILAGETFDRLSTNTITSLDSFVAQVPIWRRQGWTINDEESEPGLRAIAAPVHDFSGAIVASISISAPMFRVDENRIPMLARAARITARKVSLALGAPAKVKSATNR